MSRAPACLVVRHPGPLMSLRDSGQRIWGQPSWRRFGVPAGGVMDRASAATANALVGNPPNAAVLEFMLWGGTFEVAADSCRLAISGGAFPISAAGQWMASDRSFCLRRGDLLRIDPAPHAVWGYLAVADGFEAPRGREGFAAFSLSGACGEPLRKDHALPLNVGLATPGPDRANYRRNHPAGAPIRVVLGPQDDMFATADIRSFLRSSWRVTHQANRMGYRLEGPAIDAERGANFVSDGVTPGSIQVPGSGQPIVLLRDGPSTGGYLKIACVITADLDAMAQTGPGARLRFEAVTLREAQRLREIYLAKLDWTPQLVREMRETAAATPAQAYANDL